MKQKSKLKIGLSDYIKANRKISREEELLEHRRPVSYRKVHATKKQYNRKKNKADLNKDLPYFSVIFR